MTRLIDLDANATTAPLPEVIETVARCLRDVPGNPGSRHALGRKARRLLEDSRELMADILGAAPDEIIFTSGGTESNHLAISGLANGPRRTVVLTPGEHPSNREACQSLALRGWNLQILPVDQNGLLTEFNLQSLDWSQIGLSTTILAHNETGVIQDVGQLIRLCEEHRIPLHLDGVQAVGKIAVDFHRLGAATLSLGAHKFHGPRGIGALLVRRGTRLTPLLTGGHQESDRRAGTEPVALIAGMAKALELWHRDREQRARQLTELRDRLESVLLEQAPPAIVHGSSVPRLPNTLNMAFPGIDGEALLVALELAQICCSLGSTCASGSMEPAPILLAMGVSEPIARASLRFSVSVLNTVDEIDDAGRRIAAAVARLRCVV